MISFETSVPYHYGQEYIVNGSIAAGSQRVFSGSEDPHHFLFTLSRSQYVSISWAVVFTQILGISLKDTSIGYKSQMSARDIGSVFREGATTTSGMRIMFEFQESSSGVYISQETVKQNVITLLAQIVSVFSVCVTVGTVTFQCCEDNWKKVEEKASKNTVTVVGSFDGVTGESDAYTYDLKEEDPRYNREYMRQSGSTSTRWEYSKAE